MADALTILLDGVNITHKVDLTTVSMQLAGSQETASCSFDIIDKTNSVSVVNEMIVTLTEVGTAEVLFGGPVRSNRPEVAATGRIVHVTAYDYNSLLDRQLVVSDTRTAGESDNARLVYLMTTYGDNFSADYSLIATLEASMPAQTFVAITLRQAIERVLGQASTLSAYYIDPSGRLGTYDRSSITAAPFDVVVGTPGAGEIAVDDFTFDFDSSNLANAVYVVGATAAGSGWYTDATSIATYGRRERFFNAPDSDTSGKASQVGLAVLQDQRNPVPRGSFTTQSPSDGWRIGQSIVVTSAQHALSAVTMRIARVTVSYLTPAGRRKYRIELGAPLPTLSALLARSHGAGGGGGGWSTPGGSGWWRGVISDGTNLWGGCGCSPCCPPWDGTGTPDVGAEVQNELLFTGDGILNGGATAYPFLAGTLRIWVAGLSVAGHVTEVSPAAGTYTLDFTPTTGQTVRASYTAA